jgi:hypothetical protein
MGVIKRRGVNLSYFEMELASAIPRFLRLDSLNIEAEWS